MYFYGYSFGLIFIIKILIYFNLANVVTCVLKVFLSTQQKFILYVLSNTLYMRANICIQIKFFDRNKKEHKNVIHDI